MPNEVNKDNFKDNNSDQNVRNISDNESNDTAQNSLLNSEQPLSENNANFILNTSSELENGETNTVEIQELSSEDSSQKSSREALENVRILYEFPDDIDTGENSKSASKSQKRHNAYENNDFLAKKSRNDTNNNNNNNHSKINGNEEKHDETEKMKCIRHSSTPKKKSKDRNQNHKKGNDIKENTSSNEIINLRRSGLKLGHHSTKDNEMQPHVATIAKTSKHNGEAFTESLSDGVLADVEDNADSTSNEDVRNDPRNKYPTSSSNSYACAPDIKGGSKSNPTPSVDSTSAKHLNDKKESVSRNQSKTIKKSVKADSESNITSKIPVGKEKEATTSSATNKQKKKSDAARRNKRKCFVCNKKLGLTAITCRCGGLFCSNHRYDKEHDCSFDYKSMGAEEIRKNNPLIIAEKIPKL
ncbi:zinc finger A20 and AN1 domain-containing stress-associated protein 9 [Trichonephila clavata]|uniref:Zinc finger A20 and AN1 domain-containing stress-associated protein 9 n=1 Tax=Trichonephila clavata TaxID=2740835 RepID=A0A8X6F9A0_TRICU|nr:zinc finger A20 and AN1 domain-containing stress-associated protein 9 [Trichonephila clavata]